MTHNEQALQRVNGLIQAIEKTGVGLNINMLLNELETISEVIYESMLRESETASKEKEESGNTGDVLNKRETVWIKAWTSTVRVNDAYEELATAWADICLENFDKRFPNKYLTEKMIIKEVTNP